MSTLPFELKTSLKTIEVSGSSMSPKYENGDWLIFRTLRYADLGRPPKLHKLIALVGRVVVIERDEMPGILQIKRSLRVEDNALWVEGDNKFASTDSRNWGVVRPHELRGVVLFRYKQGSLN